MKPSPKSGARWFKKDISFFSNRKIMKAGRDGRDVFEAVLCMNAQRGSHGFIPIADWDANYIARFVGDISVTEAGNGMTRAIEASLVRVDGDCVRIVGWTVEWGTTNKTRAEIQKDYREREKERYSTGNDALPDESLVTARERDREKERERDARNADSLSLGGSEGPTVARDTAHPLPDGWRPAPEHTQLAQQLGCDLAHELAAFRAHNRATGQRFVDWNARFEKWLRGSRDKGKRKPPKPGAYAPQPKEDVVHTEDGPVRSQQPAKSAELQQGSEGRKP